MNMTAAQQTKVDETIRIITKGRIERGVPVRESVCVLYNPKAGNGHGEDVFVTTKVIPGNYDRAYQSIDGTACRKRTGLQREMLSVSLPLSGRCRGGGAAY